MKSAGLLTLLIAAALLGALPGAGGRLPAAEGGRETAADKPPAAMDSTGPAAIADSAIAQLKSKIPPPENDQRDDRAAMSRLTDAFRAGEALEQANPNAPNLHVVRNIMLEIARRLASLEADEASHDRLMGLAKRMVSEAGPPEGKLWADSLLTHARLARLELGSRDAADEIKSFASRYTDCPVAHVALMFAVDMATSNGNPQLTGELSHELLKYREQPVAEAFLRNRGLAVFDDRSLSASLTTLDGTKLRLPRDLLGKVTVLHFWSIRSRDIPFMRAFYDQYHDRGLEVIGINVDRNTREVESFVRQQGLSWPQVSTGKGFDDPLLKRLGIPDVPYYWVVGWDGRVAVANRQWEAQHPSGIISHVKLELDALTDLAERMPYYRSGEFLARTPLLAPASADSKNPTPQTALDAVRAMLLVSPYNGASRDEKARSFKEALAACRALEQQQPAADLAPLRTWMLIAARWLAVTSGDPAFAAESAATANRLLASAAAPASRMLADYVVTSTKLAELEPRTKAGAGLIQDYAARHAEGQTAWAAKILAVMLTFEDGQDGLREPLVQQLYAAYKQRPDPMVYGFLRDCCAPSFSIWRPVEGPPLHAAALRRMDGGGLALPDDLLGKVVILQFWSAAHPPKPAMMEHYDSRLPYTGLASVPSAGVVVVGVNLDDNRADAEAFLKRSRYTDWIHTFSGLGWNDPTARACDILALPRTIVLDRAGQIAIGGQFSGEDFHHLVTDLVNKGNNRRGRR